MRTLIAILLLSFAEMVQARDMFVVVHTRDALVEVYVCELGKGEVDGGQAMRRTVMRNAGYFHWHVVGGVEPYTVIESDGLVSGTVCVTVIDAVGQVATGCGVIQTFVDVRSVPCPQFNEPLEEGAASGGKEPGPDADEDEEVKVPGPVPPRPRPTPRVGPSDPQVRGGGGGNGGLTRGYSSRGPAGGGGHFGTVTGSGQSTRGTGVQGGGRGASGGSHVKPSYPGQR